MCPLIMRLRVINSCLTKFTVQFSSCLIQSAKCGNDRLSSVRTSVVFAVSLRNRQTEPSLMGDASCFIVQWTPYLNRIGARTDKTM